MCFVMLPHTAGHLLLSFRHWYSCYFSKKNWRACQLESFCCEIVSMWNYFSQTLTYFSDCLLSHLFVCFSIAELSRAVKPRPHCSTERCSICYSNFIVIKCVACSNCTNFSNACADCEVDWMDGCLDIQRTYKQTERKTDRDSLLYSWQVNC